MQGSSRGGNDIQEGLDDTDYAIKDGHTDQPLVGYQEQACPQSPDEPPNGGFGWMVVLSSFCISMIVDGVCFSQGIFFDAYRTQFNTDKATTALVASVLNGGYMLVGPLVSALVSVYGCRPVAAAGSVISATAFTISTFCPDIQLFIFTFSVFGGIGFGMMYLPAMVIVGYYFTSRRALATGIASCGSGIGAFVMAPLSELLLDEFGWRGAIYIIAGLVLNGVVFSLFYRPIAIHQTVTKEVNKFEDDVRQDTTDVESGSRKWASLFRSMFDVTLLKSPTFILYGVSSCLCNVGFFIPFAYLPTYAREAGLTSTQAVSLISIIGITNTVCRVGVGYISDKPWVDCLLVNNIALCVGGVVTFFLTYYKAYWMYCMYSLLFGLSIATFVTLRSIVMIELMGLHKLNMAYGLVSLCSGASSIVSSPIAGAMSDATGSYQYSFYMAGAAIFLSGFICFPLRRIARWEGLMTEATIDVDIEKSR